MNEYVPEIVKNPPQPLDASFDTWLNYTIIAFIGAPVIMLIICIVNSALVNF